MDFEDWWKTDRNVVFAEALKEAIRVVYEAVQEDEREACAALCDKQVELQRDTGGDDCCIAQAKRCAMSIRMRSVR